MSALGGRELSKAAESGGKMPARVLGRTGLKVSAIGLGGYHAGLPEKEVDSFSLVHRALDLGINFFDNADCYQEGRAEERMGKALEGRRKKIVLMTKVDARDAAGARTTLETSLRRLSTDYLDIWQFHGVSTIDEVNQILGPAGAMETAEKAKREGKIRFIGLTGHSNPQALLEALKRHPFDTVQMPINVVDPHFKSFRNTVLEEAVKRNVGIIAMKTLAFGRLLGFKVASAAEALCWAWSQPIGVLVSGCDRMEVLEYNVYQSKTFKPMSESEQQELLARTKANSGPLIENYKQ